LRLLVDLARPSSFESGTFKAEVKAADAGEQGADGFAYWWRNHSVRHQTSLGGGYVEQLLRKLRCRELAYDMDLPATCSAD
jgi:hypothetical protein